MAVLGRYGAMNANSVVDRTAMDKVRVSRAVARLLAHAVMLIRSEARAALLGRSGERREQHRVLVLSRC